MQKTINKIWIVLTFGMVCIFIFCVYANGALKRSKTALARADVIEERLDLIASMIKATEFRVEKIERSIFETKKAAALAQPLDSSAIGHTVSDESSNAKVSRVGNSNRKSNPAGTDALAQKSTSLDATLDYAAQESPILSVAQQQLKTFRDSMSEEQLVELSNRVEDALVGTFDKASELANFSEEQKLKVIELMGIEQLETLRAVHEKAVLMQMMAEQATREIGK